MSDLARIFSRPFLVAEVTPQGRHRRIEADEAERAALAEALGIRAVRALEADFFLKPSPDGSVILSGEVRASVEQICVVTTEPVANQVREPVEIAFGDPPRKSSPPDEEDQRDPPEPIVDGRIDLGAVAAEHLALGLDPYPRKPGAAFDSAIGENDAEASPFAALKKLRES